MIEICRFDPLQAKPSHEGTILADDVVPPSLHPPFEHAYGYLLNNRSMLGHQHPTDEIYVVTSGTGYVMVNGKNLAVRTGDVVAIPPGVYHTMLCTDRDEAPFQWAALWWPHLEGGEPVGEEISFCRFNAEAAQHRQRDGAFFTCAVPPQLKTPFGQHYGYLTKEDAVEAHSHQEEEMYLILRGKGMITVGEETAEVTGGDVVAVAPDLLHFLTAEGEELLWVSFRWRANQ